MKYNLAFATLMLCVFTCIELNAVVVHKNIDNIEPKTSLQKNKKQDKSAYAVKKSKRSIKKFKLFKRKKSGKRNWFQSLFKKKKNKTHKIKNKWMRISLKIFLYSLLGFALGMSMFLIGFTNPHTFVGSAAVSGVFDILVTVSLYVGIAALLSIIIIGIVLLFKN